MDVGSLDRGGIARPRRTARAGSSKASGKPSPTLSISRSRCLAGCSRTASDFVRRSLQAWSPSSTAGVGVNDIRKKYSTRSRPGSICRRTAGQERPPGPVRCATVTLSFSCASPTLPSGRMFAWPRNAPSAPCPVKAKPLFPSEELLVSNKQERLQLERISRERPPFWSG